jgi:glyoxylase-like metal-dependent hydrolase (beta-lactamase superfamily II)
MVDAGNSAKHADLFLTSLKEYGLPTPDYVAITHWHWDHTFGMHAVGASSIASQLTNKQLDAVSSWNWDDTSMSERLTTGEDIEFCDTHIRIEYPDRGSIVVKTADLVFDKHLHIDLGGITCELLHIGGPHSEDSVVVYLPEERIIFLGDASGGDFYHNQGKYGKDKLLGFINFIQETDFTTCVEGHDEPITKEQLLQYMLEELDKI